MEFICKGAEKFLFELGTFQLPTCSGCLCFGSIEKSSLETFFVLVKSCLYPSLYTIFIMIIFFNIES